MERLDRLLCVSGQCSRSEARVLIRAGSVAVNGIVVRRPEEKVPRDSVITVRGQVVDTAEFVYWMLHKPAGYVSASQDERWPAVIRLMPDEALRRGVFCVGRLDADVTGLLLLTDDGAYAHRVMTPRAGIERVYRVCLASPITADDVRRLARGVVWSDGMRYLPARLVRDENDPCVGYVAVMEGKYHEVKRLIASCGHELLGMRRISIGGLRLDETLEEGHARRLTPEEAERVFHKNVEVSV